MPLKEDEIAVSKNLANFLNDWKRKNIKTQSDFANEINVSEPVLSSWVNGKRAVPERVYPKIIEILGIEENQLTQKPQRSMLNYMLFKNNQLSATGSIQLLKSLRSWDDNSNQIIQEMAIVYGDYDIVMKVEISSEEELLNLLNELARHGQNPQTYRIVSDGQFQYWWQRKQDANDMILRKITDEFYYDPQGVINKINETQSWLDANEKRNTFDPFGDFFRKKFNDFFQKAIKGELEITDEELLDDYSVQLAKTVSSSIQGVFVRNNSTEGEKARAKRYFEVQKELILKSNKRIDIKRIFVGDKDTPSDSLLEIMQQHKSIGVKVSYLQSSKWRYPKSMNISPQDFAIFDNGKFVLVYKPPKNADSYHTAILYTPETRETLNTMKSYQEAFNLNLHISAPFEPEDK